MGNDTFTGEEVVVTGNLVKVEAQTHLPQNAKRRGNTEPQSDERDIWLAILSDWIEKARKSGLDIELADLRPEEQAFIIVVNGASYHADGCNTISRGSVCHKCKTDVVTGKTVVTT